MLLPWVISLQLQQDPPHDTTEGCSKRHSVVAYPPGHDHGIGRQAAPVRCALQNLVPADEDAVVPRQKGAYPPHEPGRERSKAVRVLQVLSEANVMPAQTVDQYLHTKDSRQEAAHQDCSSYSSARPSSAMRRWQCSHSAHRTFGHCVPRHATPSTARQVDRRLGAAQPGTTHASATASGEPAARGQPKGVRWWTGGLTSSPPMWK